VNRVVGAVIAIWGALVSTVQAVVAGLLRLPAGSLAVTVT
jgi:hypothetical protein